MIDEYKTIPGFSRYMASRSGDVIGTRKTVLSPYKNKKGYLILTPRSDEGTQVCVPVHRLVWMTFNGPIPGHLKVDHIDDDPGNNQLSNLQLLTNRDNVIKGKSQKSKLFKYTGVAWDSVSKNYRSRIKINRKNKDLGRFNTEHEAHVAYEKAKESLNEYQAP